MYSKLDHQTSLKRLGKLDLLGASVIKRLAFGKLSCSIVVRNPYERIASFYKDKFLRAEDYRLWMQDQGMEKGWQQSTQLFFPFLGLNRHMEPKVISEKLSKVTFEEFMNILPKVYLQDGHLTPQYLAGYFSFRILGYRVNFKLPLQMERIYQMESASDLKELSEDFQLNLKSKVNSTENIQVPLSWTESIEAAVERLYAKDFREFGYTLRGKNLL